jgi:hypothetical protein
MLFPLMFSIYGCCFFAKLEYLLILKLATRKKISSGFWAEKTTNITICIKTAILFVVLFQQITIFLIIIAVIKRNSKTFYLCEIYLNLQSLSS